MASNPDQCTPSDNVGDAALLNYDNSGLLSPWHMTSADRAAWESFAGRTLSTVQLDKLRALQYALQKYGFNHYTYKDIAADYQIDSVKTAKDQLRELRKLAIAIRMVEPFDIKSGHKSPRYLKLTPHFCQFDWQGTKKEFEEVAAAVRKERKRDPDARDLAAFICDLEAVRKSPTVGAVPESPTDQSGNLGPGSPEITDCAVRKSPTASAEIPCNNTAKFDSLQLTKNSTTKATTKTSPNQLTNGLKEEKEIATTHEADPYGMRQSLTPEGREQMLQQRRETHQRLENERQLERQKAQQQETNQHKREKALRDQLQTKCFSNKPRRLKPTDVLFSVDFFDVVSLVRTGNQGTSLVWSYLEVASHRSLDWETSEAVSISFSVETGQDSVCSEVGLMLASDAEIIFKLAELEMPGQEGLDAYREHFGQIEDASDSGEDGFALEAASSSEEQEIIPVEPKVDPAVREKAAELLKLMQQGKTPEMSQSAA